jgi:hypothetical protein
LNYLISGDFSIFYSKEFDLILSCVFYGKSVHPYRWRPPPPEVVEPELSDSLLDSEDKVLRVIEVSSESEGEASPRIRA